MTEQQFAYWLQGFAELNAAPPSAEQWQSIRDHLATVFKKVTPPLAGESPGEGLRKFFDQAKTLEKNKGLGGAIC